MALNANARIENNILILSNCRITAEISLTPFFNISFIADKNGNKVVSGGRSRLIADQDTYELSDSNNAILVHSEILNTDLLYNEAGKKILLEYGINTSYGKLTLKRHLFLYDNAPALRWYDYYESEENLSGMYYSDIGSFKIESSTSPYCVDYFNCTDQSNYRLHEFSACTKNKSGFMIFPENDGDSGVFIYKEGPMPDSQPIKGDYDFLWNEHSSEVNILGLGFDSLHAGELRRANGVVIGLIENKASLVGLHRYQKERYKCNVDKEVEVLTNSWPTFGCDIDEEKILGEIKAASNCGVDTVFIDAGWFDTFMGDIHTEKFPSSFHKIRDTASTFSVNVGLWMNPLGMDTSVDEAKEWDGAECHDTIKEGNDWNYVARSNDFTPVEFGSLGKNGSYHGMDLCNPKYFTHIKNKVIRMYKYFSIRHFKFDLYQLDRFNTLLGDANIHYEKYRTLLHKLKIEIPDLVISMDVTRRNRPNFDFGLDYGRLFLENRGRKEKDQRYYQPYIALRNLWSTIKYAPACKLEIEMMPQICDPEYSLEYILGTTLFGNPLYWGSLCEMPSDKQGRYKAFLEKLKPYRKEILNGLVFTIGAMPEKGNCSAIISLNSNYPDKLEGYIGIFRNGGGNEIMDTFFAKHKLNFQTLFGKPLSVDYDKIIPEFSADFEFQLHLFTS